MASRYTVVHDPNAQAYVDEILRMAINRILAQIGRGNCIAILLTGSFGRGEGGVRQRGDGWAIVNDIELVVIQDEPTPRLLNGLGEQLASQYGIYKVEIDVRRRSDLKLKGATMQNYDERYGSQVIYGDPRILEEMGEFNARDIPMWEGARLLLNRAGGLVMHFTWPRYLARAELDDDVQHHMKNQLVKAGVALGDALIVCHRCYHTSYRKRWDIFESLVAARRVQLPAGDITLINRSYEEKLFPNTHSFFSDLFPCYEAIVRAYVPLFLRVMSEHFQTPIPSVGAYVDEMRGRAALWRRTSIRDTLPWRTLRAIKRAMLARRLPRRADWQHRQVTSRETVYAALPLVLRSAPFLSHPEREDLNLAERLLSVSLGPSGRERNYEQCWERVRTICFEEWYATCH